MRRAGAPGSRPRADVLTAIVCVGSRTQTIDPRRARDGFESEEVGTTSEVAARIRQAEELTTLAAPGNGPGSTAKWEIPRSTHHSAGIERGQGCRSRFPKQIFSRFRTTACVVNVSLVREFSTVRERTVWSLDERPRAAFVGALRSVFAGFVPGDQSEFRVPRITGSGRHRRMAVPVTDAPFAESVRSYGPQPPCAARESRLKFRAGGCGDSHSRSRSRTRAASTAPSASSCTNFPNTAASGSSPLRACR